MRIPMTLDLALERAKACSSNPKTVPLIKMLPGILRDDGVEGYKTFLWLVRKSLKGWNGLEADSCKRTITERARSL